MINKQEIRNRLVKIIAIAESMIRALDAPVINYEGMSDDFSDIEEHAQKGYAECFEDK